MIRTVDRKNLALREASLDPNSIYERHFYINHGLLISSMTVDNTCGHFTWHVGVMRSESPEPTLSWDNTLRRKAIAKAKSLLNGIGDGEVSVEWGDYALHVRKELSEQDMELLSSNIRSFIKRESDMILNQQ